MTLAGLITMVTLRVDEYTEDIEGEAPEAPVGDITNELKQSAKSILRKMARHTAMIPSKSVNDIILVQPTPEETRGTVIPLPEDYLRFISLKMGDWKRPATKWVSDASSIFKQQIYSQRRGTPEKPVAGLIPYHAGNPANPSKRALEVFPRDGSLENLVYVPYLEPEAMPEDFVDAMSWHAAGSVLIIMRLPEQAKGAFEKADMALAELNQGVYGEDG